MSFIQEFKAFAMRGNVVDLAVWVVIGWAFGKIVSSMVSDVIMPVVGVLTGGVNFTDYKLVIRKAVEELPGIQKWMPEVTLNWWSFVQASVDFIIVALCIFIVIKMMAKFHKSQSETEKTQTEKPKGPSQEELLTEIRDLLKKS